MGVLGKLGFALFGLVAFGCLDRDVAPIEPTTVTAIDVRIEQAGVSRVDIVFLVDNSGSMQEEQTELANRIRGFLTELVSPPDRNDDTLPDYPAVEDLNIGVISSDMGVMGYRGIRSCDLTPDFGDDGCFRNTVRPGVTGCPASYSERWLSRNPVNAGSYSAAQMANDFACIGTLGITGCGFEQQLKAMRKALFENQGARGCNEGFLRPDSIVTLIFVTDEEDCSVNPDYDYMFDMTRTDLDGGRPNLRCFLNPDKVQSVSEYVTAFRSLREDASRIFIAMIVGVPPDAPACEGDGDELGACLAVPAMEPRRNAAGDNLETSCDVPGMGTAYPPVRFVQLAMDIEREGVDTYVSSICRADWTNAIRTIAEKIGSRIPSACFARALDFTLEDPNPDEATDRDCSADCRVVETYGGSEPWRPCMIQPGDENCICEPTTAADFYPPPCKIAGTETPCEPFKRDLGCIGGPCPGAGEPPYGRRQCLVRQAPRTFDGSRCSAAARPGWYYVPADANGPGDPPCHQLVLEVSGLPIIEDGSSADLRCLAFLCPESRQCGTSEHPTAGCCASGHRGTTGVGRTMGECRPESCPDGQTPAAVACSTAGETEGRCE